MNSFTLAVASIRLRPLYAVLCTMAVAAGIALLCAVFLFSQTVASGFERNAKNIDVVVGVKGSPLQLVLSSVYQADVPAGNITMEDYDNLKHMPQIRQAIPMAMGDNYKGFRMIGTTPDYLKLYDGELAEGEIFKTSYEAVAGADTGLSRGEKIAVTHGFSENSDDVHNDHLYTITGILKPTGTVMDKLLITNVEGVQQVHGGHHHHEDEHHGDDNEHHHDEADNHHGDHHGDRSRRFYRYPIVSSAGDCRCPTFVASCAA